VIRSRTARYGELWQKNGRIAGGSATCPSTIAPTDLGSLGGITILNMATKGVKAGTTYVYQVTLSDGSTIDFRFGLK
jgi:hypothetical protein